MNIYIGVYHCKVYEFISMLDKLNFPVNTFIWPIIIQL